MKHLEKLILSLKKTALKYKRKGDKNKALMSMKGMKLAEREVAKIEG